MKESVSNYLLQSKAIKLQPTKPFTWASGWKSPIYCDNRKTLSYPEIRTFVKNSFVELIRKEFPEVQTIAGVATGAIAQGALVAEEMGLPFVYVRSKAKDHGLANLIEGDLREDCKKVVVVEDLISTGGSSLAAVEALRAAGAEVLGLVAIFSYRFPVSEENFKRANCRLLTLTDYPELIDIAVKMDYVHPDQLEVLKAWREHPDTWQGC